MIPVNEFSNPKECTEWHSVTIPQEIEKHLLKRNQTHFGQARGTFPTTSPFSEHIDWAASTHEADLILEGEYDNEEIVDAGKLLIEQMKRTTKLDSINKYLTEDEWTGKLKKWRESTSTSP